MKLRLFCILLLLGAASLHAELTKVLVPIALPQEVPGAFGSLWATRLRVRNNGTQPITVAPNPGATCGSTVCPSFQVAGQTTVSPLVAIAYPYPGAFLYVTPGANASFNTRIQDLSRQSLTWGTEIPVVREADVFTDTLTLINIPTDDRFRSALRIYDFDGASKNSVRVRVFADDETTPVADTELVLATPSGINDSNIPGFAQIGSIVDAYPALRSATTTRVEITPVAAGTRIWAFVSVTNNETQHVTTITPQ
ncbi:MAG TPA: hypothetical protein VJZ76_03450 [Thermoanaerobaculia bacterium]|nr:hypothetical protein [Thermoanaerobaculia bacterium]